MKVLTIMGSPKKSGNTATILKQVEEKLRIAGHEVEHVNIIDYHIAGCLGCGACMANKTAPGCVQQDDLLTVLDKYAEADAILLASPIYSFFLTAQLKALMDRCFCLIGTPWLNGKRVAMLLDCSGEGDKNADLAQKFFCRAFDGTNGSIPVGTYVVDRCYEPDFSQRADDISTRIAQELPNTLQK